MRGTAPKEDECWVLARTPAYSNALQAVARSRFRHAYRYLCEAERLLISTEGNPPGVFTVENADIQEQVCSAELIEEAASIDPEYDEDLFKHHAQRVRCFFHKNILICFTLCEMSEVITMTTFKLPDEIFSNSHETVSSDMRRYFVSPVHPRPGYTMELTNSSVVMSKAILLFDLAGVKVPAVQRYSCDLADLTIADDLRRSPSNVVLKDVARSIDQLDLSCSPVKTNNRALSLRSLELIKTYCTMLLFK